MFDLSFGEILVIGGVALVVLGPERLPHAARTVGQWTSRIRRYVQDVKYDLKRELDTQADLKLVREVEAELAAEGRKILGELPDPQKIAQAYEAATDNTETASAAGGDTAAQVVGTPAEQAGITPTATPEATAPAPFSDDRR